MARPRKEIDWNQFEQLCALQCTFSEISSFLKIHIDTLRDRARAHYKDDYSNIYKKFSETGKCSLRRNQFALSKKNASMAIWLGKVLLGQKDPAMDEAKEEALEAVKAAVREIQREPRIEASQRSSLEDEQSLLDQQFRRRETEVSA